MFHSPDTRPAAEQMMQAHLLRIGPGGRLKLALQLSDDMRRVALAGARFRAERAGGGDPEAEVRQMYLGKANVALVDARLASQRG